MVNQTVDYRHVLQTYSNKKEERILILRNVAEYLWKRRTTGMSTPNSIQEISSA